MAMIKETRGRKALPKDQHKRPQKVVKVNETILPLVMELKGYLRNNKLSSDTIQSLFDVLHRKPERNHVPANTIDILGENKTLKGEVNRLTIKSNKEVIKAAELEGELNKYKAANLKLVQRYDAEHLELVGLQGKRMSNQSTINALKQEVDRLKHLEYDCQALTKSGIRCTRPAKVKSKYRGIEINTCLQHRDIK